MQFVEETSGNPPGKAVDLVLRLISNDGADINQQFLWIADGLQAAHAKLEVALQIPSVVPPWWPGTSFAH